MTSRIVIHQNRNGKEDKKPRKPSVVPVSTVSIPIQDRTLSEFNPPSDAALAILAKPRVRPSQINTHH